MRASCARRMTATCAAGASTSATSGCPACRRWLSCAARWHMPASRRSTFRLPSAIASSSPMTWAASLRSAPTPRSPVSSRPCSQFLPVARCATSASWSPCAWRRRGPRLRTWWPRSTWISSRCRWCTTCWPAASPARRWCMSTGATTSSSPPPPTWISRPSRPRPPSPSRASCAPPVRPCARSKAAAWSQPGTPGSIS